MLSWARFVTFDGEDLTDLFETIKENEEYRRKEMIENEEPQSKIDGLKDSIYIRKPISLKNEKQVWIYVKSYAEKAMEKYPSGIEEDRKLLEKGGLTYNI